MKPKRVIRNPQPKLDAERLKGPRGLAALEGYFKNVKFKGPKHEEEDLRKIMKIYEYWCHRMFPKYPFDDCLAKLEKLGTKRPVQVFFLFFPFCPSTNIIYFTDLRHKNPHGYDNRRCTSNIK